MEYLPIGSTVTLKRAEDMLFVIIGLYVENPKGEHRDYIAVRHPMGAVDSMHFFFFNQGDIENIVQKGVADEMHEKYDGLLNLTAYKLEME
mgnify:FL=1